MRLVAADILADAERLQQSTSEDLQAIGRALREHAAAHGASTERIVDLLATQPEAARGAAFDYLMQTGYLFGGWQLALAAEVAQRRSATGDGHEFHARKLATSLFYAENLLPRCAGYAGAIAGAEGALLAYPVDWL